MLVPELIEWLKGQDQGATVRVVVHTSGRGYYDQGGNATTEVFTSELTEYSDYRGMFNPDHPVYNTRELLLGVVDG